MTDRELLELAAKAAGIGPCCWNAAVYAYEGGPLLKHGGIWDYKTGSSLWNPLENDADALRLATKLRIMVEFDKVDAEDACAYAYHGGRRYSELLAGDHNRDHDAATRRAIVRAAAQIGKAQP